MVALIGIGIWRSEFFGNLNFDGGGRGKRIPSKKSGTIRYTRGCGFPDGEEVSQAARFHAGDCRATRTPSIAAAAAPPSYPATAAEAAGGGGGGGSCCCSIEPTAAAVGADSGCSIAAASASEGCVSLFLFAISFFFFLFFWKKRFFFSLVGVKLCLWVCYWVKLLFLFIGRDDLNECKIVEIFFCL